MAIGRATRSETDIDAGNPHIADIDQRWIAIREAMAGYDGAQAARLFEDIERRQVSIANACYWRTNEWLVSWFRERDSRSSDVHHMHTDFANDCFVNWIRGIYTDRSLAENWKPQQLPFMLQELRKHGAMLAEQRTTRGYEP